MLINWPNIPDLALFVHLNIWINILHAT